MGSRVGHSNAQAVPVTMNLPPVLTALLAIPLAEAVAPSADSSLFGALVQEQLTLDSPDCSEWAVVGEEASEEDPAAVKPVAKEPRRTRAYSAADSLLAILVTRLVAAPAPPKILPKDVKPETITPEVMVTDTAGAETITREVLPPTTDTVPPNDKITSPVAQDTGGAATHESVKNAPFAGEPPKTFAPEDVDEIQSRAEPPRVDYEPPGEETERTIVPTPPASSPRIAETNPIPAARHEPASERSPALPANRRPSRIVPERNPSPLPAKSNAPIAFALSWRLPEPTVSETESAEPAPVDREAPDAPPFVPEPVERPAVRPAAEATSPDAEERSPKRDDHAVADKKAFPLPERPVALPLETAVPSARATQPSAPAALAETVPAVTAPVALTTMAPERTSSEPRVPHPVAASSHEVSSDVRPDLEIRQASAPLEIRIDLPRSTSDGASHAASPRLDLPYGALANEAPYVQLQLREHRGEVTVSVRTADASLSQTLHERLPELVARLEGQGYEARAADSTGRLPPETARSVEATWRNEESPAGARDGGTPPEQQQSSQQRQQHHSQQQQQREAEPDADSRRSTRQAVRWLEAWRTNHYTETTR